MKVYPSLALRHNITTTSPLMMTGLINEALLIAAWPRSSQTLLKLIDVPVRGRVHEKKLLNKFLMKKLL